MGSFWKGELLKHATNQAAINGLHDAAEHILAESKKQTPYDEGTLENSALIETSQNGLAVVISYNTPYAAKQHEELGYHHPRKGKAKYLEDPIREEAATTRDIINAAIRRAL